MSRGVKGRVAAKRDANEPEIVNALVRAGATVERLSMQGVPDLLVGYQGRTYLIEVKTEKGSLTDDQREWVSDWRGGRVRILRSIDQVELWLNECIVELAVRDD